VDIVISKISINLFTFRRFFFFKKKRVLFDFSPPENEVVNQLFWSSMFLAHLLAFPLVRVRTSSYEPKKSGSFTDVALGSQVKVLGMKQRGQRSAHDLR